MRTILLDVGEDDGRSWRCLPREEWVNILPDRCPFIIAPNHVSYLDAFAVAAALDYSVLGRTYWAGWTGAAFACLAVFCSASCPIR